MIRLHIDVKGIVQGVGFRPFVAREAKSLLLSGFVRNTAYGVHIECEGEPASCQSLLEAIRGSPPPGAMLFSVSVTQQPSLGEPPGFRILTSDGGAADAGVSPDLGICDDCRRELLDPADRRYRYPFINCTNCGPRFSILRKIPYDRVNTTMSGFEMCPDCRREYGDVDDRRFHAQPDACPVCGPQLSWLSDEKASDKDPVALFADAIRAGKVVAVKGLGGFHLACDPANEDAVALLRARKQRYEKPFALMARDIKTAAALCEISDSERAELLSPRKPIVLLKRRKPQDPPKEPSSADIRVCGGVAPGSSRLGIMLPYTPLHVLLTQECPLLVMTSSNVSDAPMAFRDEEMPHLRFLCDAVLTHNRPILRRVDDSVCCYIGGERRLIRRARGFAPQPVPLSLKLSGTDAVSQMRILSFGGQLKNTFCFCRGGLAYLSSHVGDLDDAETHAFYENEIPAFLSLFGGNPQLLACDRHPDYASVRLAKSYAKEHHLPLVEVQHHHAHFASVLAEHGLSSALGFIFDGTGYGSDGTIWGGELLLGSVSEVRRIGCIRPLRLPGGESAIREPWRTALWAVADACGDERALSHFRGFREAPALLKLARRGAFSPVSTGMGRLFDVFAVVAGLRPRVSYEGQAAVMLEQACDDRVSGSYSFELYQENGLLYFDWRPVLQNALSDMERGQGAAAVSTRFHRAVTELIARTALRYPGLPVVLSGGVFQNARLLESSMRLLKDGGISAYTNSLVPANDGGISFGQAAVAAALYHHERGRIQNHVSCHTGPSELH